MYYFLVLFVIFLICQVLLGDELGLGTTISYGTNQEYSAECNNLAQYLVHENALDDLIDLLSYDRKSILIEDANGWSPLHEAANIGDPLMISFLVENGVNALARTKEGHTARQILEASRPTSISANHDNFVASSFKLSETILEKAENGKGLDNHIINMKAIHSSDEVILQFPGLANALVFYELGKLLEDLIILNPDVIDEIDENGWTPLQQEMAT